MSPGVMRATEALRNRAQSFMQAHARGTMSAFATETEARSWMLKAAEQKWSDCERCPLSTSRNKVVYGEGSPDAELLIIGEAPGENEDQEGRPFVGPAGSILRRMLGAPTVGLGEVPTFITNVVACFPKNGSGQPRKPEKEEREACHPRLIELVSILRPRVILLLGATAAHLVGIREISANRGLVPRTQWPDLGEGSRRLRAIVATFHPAFVLRQASRVRKKTAFANIVHDLILTRRALAQIRREAALNGKEAEAPSDIWEYNAHGGDDLEAPRS